MKPTGRTLNISYHALIQFQRRFNGDPVAEPIGKRYPNLSPEQVIAITQELQVVYRASVTLTPQELAYYDIAQQKGYEYRKCKYRRANGKTVLLIMVLGVDRTVVTVIKGQSYDSETGRVVSKVRKKRNRRKG